jgi:hypothetical protein
MTIRRPALALLASVLLAGGCDGGVGMALLSAGAGTTANAGINHTVNGIAARTFTAPAADVHQATLAALKTMGIPVDDDRVDDTVRTIKGRASDRDIDIDIQTMTPRATRLSVTASHDLVFKDGATAGEIVDQTARALAHLQAKRTKKVARRR